MQLKKCHAIGPCANCGTVVECDSIHLTGKHDRVICSYACALERRTKREQATQEERTTS